MARLGDPKKSFQFFEDSYQPNELPPFNVIAKLQVVQILTLQQVLEVCYKLLFSVLAV